ncbi:DUF2533 family protein [Bacillus solitudinis]|uniref:DUF2533 family protein n=1 Tax=Bacillus solitudinis TaxID=2014074 RepID=UPI000C2416D8|nr:DUF2533 family protein [Bacillus solitudinis]
MSVHIQIAEQVKNHRQAQKQFLQLDAKREQEIKRLIEQAKLTEEVSVIQLNKITEEMNQIATKFHFPMRKIVTKDMVIAFARN